MAAVWELLCGSVLAGLLASTAYAQPQIVSPGYRAPAIREESAPYPMNYADEAALTLGISHGQIDILSLGSRRDHEFRLRGGIDHGVPELRLQWPTN